MDTLREPPRHESEPFTLVGGPLNDTVLIVDRCTHGHWPNLVHPRGVYTLTEGTYLYKWTPNDDES